MKPQQFIRNACKQYRPMKYVPIFKPNSTISVVSLKKISDLKSSPKSIPYG